MAQKYEAQSPVVCWLGTTQLDGALDGEMFRAFLHRSGGDSSDKGWRVNGNGASATILLVNVDVKSNLFFYFSF